MPIIPDNLAAGHHRAQRDSRLERTDLPELARFVLEALARLVCDLAQRLQAIEKKLISWHYRNDLSNRLETIPEVGFVTASALASDTRRHSRCAA
ncbi:hypothetical protein [Mesorhizobium jarvisii]|nr:MULTISPECIES: hypothetical protein [Mesorhizobium]